MINFNKKVLVFTDLHFGIHSNSPSYAEICTDTMSFIKDYCSENNIENILFMGDFFDSRASIDVKTLNIASKSLYDIAENGINISLILGNHDIYLRDSTSIHSLFAFGGHKNIDIIDTPLFCKDGVGNDIILLPWMFGTPTNTVDVPRGTKYVFSHHNFPNNFFFNKGSQNGKKYKSDSYVSSTPYEDEYGVQQNLMETLILNKGLFVSGHIHNQRIIPIGDGESKIIIEGSPYETNWGFGDIECGFYIFDTNNCIYEFIKNPFNKKHVEIRTSEYQKVIDKIDYQNSIIRINVDTQESFDTISKIQSSINSKSPFSVENTKYEFTVAEFIGSRDENENPLNSIEHQVSSKLDYIIRAIDKTDFSPFDYVDGDSKKTVDKERLKEIAKDIYNLI